MLTFSSRICRTVKTVTSPDILARSRVGICTRTPTPPSAITADSSVTPLTVPERYSSTRGEPPQLPGVDVRDREAECVGGVGRCRRRRKSEELRDHQLHLLLVRSPVAGDRLLDLAGRVLGDL